ncbi:hypothetical protein DFS34DRAFT_654447 [Phlyctochytrium arcticum]|nr:hypothetical protein DFS34DRAFT_654447 [Phlyctochytrium arcticum]
MLTSSAFAILMAGLVACSPITEPAKPWEAKLTAEPRLDPTTGHFVSNIFHSNGTEIPFDDFFAMKFGEPRDIQERIAAGIANEEKPTPLRGEMGDTCWDKSKPRLQNTRDWQTGSNRVGNVGCGGNTGISIGAGLSFTASKRYGAGAEFGYGPATFNMEWEASESSTSTNWASFFVPAGKCGTLAFRADMKGFEGYRDNEHCCKWLGSPVQCNKWSDYFYFDAPKKNSQGTLSGTWYTETW